MLSPFLNVASLLCPRQISIKKGSFGFIKCCERHNEVLFNFDELDHVDPEELQLGDDVAFTVKWDLEKGKQIAIK